MLFKSRIQNFAKFYRQTSIIPRKYYKKHHRKFSTCPVCFESQFNKYFSCSHTLCTTCRRQLRSFQCPLCRKNT